MRGLMIWLGIELVNRFDFILYIFGAFLLVSAWRMFFVKQQPKDFGQSWVMRCCNWAFPVTPVFHDEHFKVRVNNRWMLTPLALALIVIDVMDLVFAVDSIPAVFAITRDTFIVYTSNVCAILGLRSHYFLLAKLIDRFIYLKNGLAIVLAFVGAKMILRDVFYIPTPVSLAFIVVTRQVPSTILILAAWAFGGLIALAGAFIYAELSSQTSTSGGQYVYLRDAFHPALAFVYGWALLLVTQSGGMAAVAVTFAKYVCALGQMEANDTVAALLATIVLIALTIINCLGVRAGSTTQNLFMILKLIAIAALVGFGLTITGAPASAIATPTVVASGGSTSSLPGIWNSL